MNNKQIGAELDKQIAEKQFTASAWSGFNILCFIGVVTFSTIFFIFWSISYNDILFIVIDIFFISFFAILLEIVFFVSIGKKKKVIALKKARWIAEHWVKDKQLDKDFFKYVYFEFDDDIDGAISILITDYEVKT